MVRKPDADIAWRARHLSQALDECVRGDGRMDGISLAIMHLEDPDPKTAALAHAAFRAVASDIDANNTGYRTRMVAAQKTRRLAHSIKAWAKQVAPIVEDNRRRAEQLGAKARMFTANEIPERVAQISRVVDALTDLADLFARQLYYPEMVPAKAGKPTDFVLKEITRILFTGGYSVDEIAKLTDRGNGDKIKRVRHRLGSLAPLPSRVVVPVVHEQPIKPGRRPKVRPTRPRR